MKSRYPAEKRLCRCGCKGLAMFRVKSEDPEGPFTEYCCGSTRDYLRACAAECGASFESIPLADVKRKES